MNLERAAHEPAELARRLREQMDAASPTPLDTGRIAMDNACALGQWLHEDGRSRHGDLPAWQRCVQAHANFHRAAGSVAAAVNRGDHAAARAMLAAGTPFSGASRALDQALQDLARAVADQRQQAAAEHSPAPSARTDAPTFRDTMPGLFPS
ncbi:MAG: CZB domain-containing protein [Burkholderiaceae bacterium]|nr:CZB domain-containing protein [Burkholderiaceae bacterium]